MISHMTPSAYRFNYDTIASEYASKVDSAPFNTLYERPAMLGMLPLIEGSRILDAGCGSGWYAEQLLARGAIVDAVDSSPAMVEYARERFKRLPSPGKDNISVQVADLDRPFPFESGIFNGIVSPLVLHYIADWRPALREMHRVLSPGGWLLFSTHHPSADAARFSTANYFATERVTDHWDWVGDVEFYRRSLTEILASVADARFAIERLVEPIPTEEFRLTEPESYARILHRPDFLIVKSTRRD